jgi:hypothetical protein
MLIVITGQYQYVCLLQLLLFLTTRYSLRYVYCNYFWYQFSLNFFYSANVTNAESPFKIEQKDAEDIITKSPQPGSPQPIESIGMYERML